jgi:hypothetical protein
MIKSGKTIITLFLFWVSLAQAEVDFEASGYLVSEARWIQKPSGQSGQNSFSIPAAGLALNFEDERWGEIFFKGVTQSTNAGRARIQDLRASLALSSESFWRFEVGILQLEAEAARAVSDFARKSIPEDQYSLVRWGYLPESDVGFRFVREDFDSLISLSVVNGEGEAFSETGSNKDLHIFARKTWDSVALEILLARGAFENVSAEESHHELAAVGLSYSGNSDWRAALQFFAGSDPADGVNGKVAEKINLTALGGQRLRSRGSRFEAAYLLNPEWQIAYRNDTLLTSENERGYDFQSQRLGLLFSPRKAWKWAADWVQTGAADLQAASLAGVIKDNQSWRFSFELAID